MARLAVGLPNAALPQHSCRLVPRRLVRCCPSHNTALPSPLPQLFEDNYIFMNLSDRCCYEKGTKLCYASHRSALEDDKLDTRLYVDICESMVRLGASWMWHHKRAANLAECGCYSRRAPLPLLLMHASACPPYFPAAESGSSLPSPVCSGASASPSSRRW